jgi:hypothetical protein
MHGTELVEEVLHQAQDLVAPLAQRGSWIITTAIR